jgi:hypothetical protein
MPNLNPNKTYLDNLGRRVQVREEKTQNSFGTESCLYGSYFQLISGVWSRLINIPLVPNKFTAQDLLDEYATARGWRIWKG